VYSERLIHSVRSGNSGSWSPVGPSRGEAELAAWELGTGLRDRSHLRYAIRVFGFMLPRFPRRLRAAFIRGRNCRNLLGGLDDAILCRTVAEVRTELGLDGPVPE
jgi:hypothetical protein